MPLNIIPISSAQDIQQVSGQREVPSVKLGIQGRKKRATENLLLITVTCSFFISSSQFSLFFTIVTIRIVAMAVDYAPPQCLAKPIEVPSKLLMGAGPSNAAERVLKAGSLPLLGHLHAEFVKVHIVL